VTIHTIYYFIKAAVVQTCVHLRYITLVRLLFVFLVLEIGTHKIQQKHTRFI
jgi:hypothetical protein